jgi:glucosyl-dolichyl phosphate glucuronosyltransferase
MAPCDVSIVICTYNRAAEVGRALDAVLAQRDAPPHEVIVVDNNSTDATRDVIEARARTSPHLRYVFEGRQGLPYARNAGIAAVRAPIVAFTDDDIIVAPDWVASIARAFDRFPDADMIGGRVLPRWPGGGPPAWLTPKQLAPLALQDKGDAPLFVDRDNAAPCLIGANFAFRRSAFEKAGLFDSEYTRTQDREIQIRLWKAGGRGVYVPDLVTHVDVPADRLTKDYFRLWYTRAGRFHSRMGLLDVLDANGRMVEPDPERRIAGAPAFLYPQLLGAVCQALRARMARNDVGATYHGNRARYLAAYLRERWRLAGATLLSAAADVRRYLARRKRTRTTSPDHGAATLGA